ncbi:MAG: cytochrome P450, partial [Spirochaetales bacterium]|nr:cytochrome P450 [Spirochaetales bacterium]
MLKNIGKALSKDRYKFYKPRSTEIQPNFARFLYEIYKSIYAVRRLVQPSDTSGALRMVVIEISLNRQQAALRDQLDEKSIREQARTMDVKDVAEHVKSVMIDFVGTFDAGRVKKINALYGNLKVFIAFCHFDFYFTLKKFDSAVSEDSFTYKPRFETIDAEYVLDDIRDFLEVAGALPSDADWDTLFDLLSNYRNIEVVDRAQWQKITRTLFQVLNSRVLEQIVQHASSDPNWISSSSAQGGRIVEPYLNEMRNSVERTLQKIADERRNNKIEQLVKQVFGTTVVTRTKHYTTNANVMFQKIDAAGFLYIDALNYLKAYLLDFFKKDVRDVVQDILIVRGKWTTQIQSQQISDAYHGVLSVSEQIIKIDDNLAEEGELGQKLRRAMGRVVDRDPSTHKLIRDLLEQINGDVLRLINEG